MSIVRMSSEEAQPFEPGVPDSDDRVGATPALRRYLVLATVLAILALGLVAASLYVSAAHSLTTSPTSGQLVCDGNMFPCY